MRGKPIVWLRLCRVNGLKPALSLTFVECLSHSISRVIYGFDDYSTTQHYRELLEEIIQVQESFSPILHVKKFELVKGDASDPLPKWLEKSPHAIEAMAILDKDVYKPTRNVSQGIPPRLARGSVLVSDEVNCGQLPRETAAVALWV